MKGLSLIELMVVTAMMMVVMGGGTVALNNFNGRQKLVAAKDELVASLRLARSAARNSKGPAGGEIGHVTVTVENGGRVLATDSLGGIVYVDKNVVGSDMQLTTTGGEMIFLSYEAKLGKVEGGKAVPAVFGSDYRITITSLAVGTTAVVVIDSEGLIDGQ